MPYDYDLFRDWLGAYIHDYEVYHNNNHLPEILDAEYLGNFYRMLLLVALSDIRLRP